MSYGEKKRFSRWRPPPSWIFKNWVFGHVNRIRFNICYSVRNFIKIGRFFTEIWRFNDFRNGGRPPSWISKICRFCHLALEPASPPFWKSLNRHISVKNCPILMKFGKLHQILNPVTVTWPKNEFFGIQDGGNRHLLICFFGHNSSTDCPISAKFCMGKQNGVPTKATW